MKYTNRETRTAQYRSDRLTLLGTGRERRISGLQERFWGSRLTVVEAMLLGVQNYHHIGGWLKSPLDNPAGDADDYLPCVVLQ